MRVDFYQLAGIPIERTVPQLAEKVLAAGERLLLVAGDETLAGMLDAQLWAYEPAAFLPHGRAGEEGEGGQPILVSGTMDPANGARFVMIADGHWREEALGFERVLYLFDAATLDEARSAWRGLAKREDAEPHYWKHEGGRWREGP